jgi:hypothetical protein
MLSCKSCARAFRVEGQQRIVSSLRQECIGIALGPKKSGDSCKAFSFQLSAFSFRLSAFSFQPSAFSFQPSHVSNPLFPPPTAFCIRRATGPEGPPFLLAGTTLAGAGAILKFQILNCFALSAHCLVTPDLCSPLTLGTCHPAPETWTRSFFPTYYLRPTTYQTPGT